jgi:deazaflavin-dependent oxidoreductase (nitroreductase family)
MMPKDEQASARQRPPWIMRHVFDPLTLLLVGRLGMDDHNGTRVLEVQGRKSGKWRATPVRVLDLDGHQYLVAMYGESGWARNLRTRGSGRLRLGKQVLEFQADELTGETKLPVFRAYLRRWWSLVGRISGVPSPDVPDEELAVAAAKHPVFRLS